MHHHPPEKNEQDNIHQVQGDESTNIKVTQNKFFGYLYNTPPKYWPSFQPNINRTSTQFRKMENSRNQLVKGD